LLREAGAAARRGGETPEPAHGVGVLLHAPVVLFDAVIFETVGAVAHRVAARLAAGARGGVVPVRRHLRGRGPGAVQGLGEAPPGRVPVPRRAQPRVDQIPLPVDRPVAGTPATVNRDIRLIRMPLGACGAAPFGAQLRGDQWGEARLPVPHRLVREDEAALEEHLGHIPQAALITQAPQHHEQDDVSGGLHVIERRAGALVADPPAAGAAEGALAQRRPLGRLVRGRHGAVGARHCLLLRSRQSRNTTKGKPAPPGATSEI